MYIADVATTGGVGTPPGLEAGLPIRSMNTAKRFTHEVATADVALAIDSETGFASATGFAEAGVLSVVREKVGINCGEEV
jgi:hypothetical protein